MKNLINGKTIFITGGTGSFGSAMTNTLLTKYKPKKIIIFIIILIIIKISI